MSLMLSRPEWKAASRSLSRSFGRSSAPSEPPHQRRACTARRSLRRLPDDVQRRSLTRLGELGQEPRPSGARRLAESRDSTASASVTTALPVGYSTPGCVCRPRRGAAPVVERAAKGQCGTTWAQRHCCRAPRRVRLVRLSPRWSRGFHPVPGVCDRASFTQHRQLLGREVVATDTEEGFPHQALVKYIVRTYLESLIREETASQEPESCPGWSSFLDDCPKQALRPAGAGPASLLLGEQAQNLPNPRLERPGFGLPGRRGSIPLKGGC